MTRKILAVLAALLGLLALAAPAMAAEGTCGEGIAWTLEGSTLKISGSGKMADGCPWSEYKDSISQAVIGDGITYVGADAFRDFDGLTSVQFGSAVYEIGPRAFRDCDGLTSIGLPASFKIFGEESFRGCKNLTAIYCQGRFPSFKNNCLWDVKVNIYYPAAKPWSLQNIDDLEKAFSGRITFLASDGSDPHDALPPQPTETQPKPTPAPTPAPPATTYPQVTFDTAPPPDTHTAIAPTVPTPEVIREEEEGSAWGWIGAVIVVGLLAGGAAVYLQAQQNRRRRRRRRRPNF